MEINGYLITSDPITPVKLKRLLLNFDSISIINPDEDHYLLPAKYTEIRTQQMTIVPEAYHPFYNWKAVSESNRNLIYEADYCYKKNYLKVFSPNCRSVYQRYWLPLRLAYEYDSGNRDFINETRPLLKKEKIDLENGILRGGFIQPAGMKLYPDIPSTPNVFSAEEKEYNFNSQSLSILARLNRDLIISDLSESIPVFTDKTLAKIYEKKLDFINKNKKSILQEGLSESDVDLKLLQVALEKISVKIIDDAILDSIPFDEFMMRRNKMLDTLYKTRKSFLITMKELDCIKYSGESLKKIDEYISKRFLPEFKNYNSKFMTIMAEVFRLESIGIFSIIGYAIGMLNCLSPSLIALLTGTSAIVGDKTSNLVTCLHNQNKSKFKQKFHYYIDFKNESA